MPSESQSLPYTLLSTLSSNGGCHRFSYYCKLRASTTSTTKITLILMIRTGGAKDSRRQVVEAKEECTAQCDPQHTRHKASKQTEK